MDKIFPSTTSKPEKIKIFALIPSWLWVFYSFTHIHALSGNRTLGTD